MDIQPQDILEMKKPHPCGARQFLVLRAEKFIKKVTRSDRCGNETP